MNTTFKPTISVIMPVYNSAQFLPKAIESITNQTLSNWELICINDGSKDTSLDILNKFAQKDIRIKIINQKNQGQAIARNKGLDAANGQYIYFLDSDDSIHEQTFEIMYNVAKKTECPIVAMDNILKLSNLDKNNKNYQIDNIEYYIHNNPLQHLLHSSWSSSVIWNKLYKKEILKGWKFIEGIYYEDWPLVTCLFSTIDKYATIPYALYIYNDTNISTVRSTFTIKKINDYITGIRFTHQYFQTKDKIKYAKEVRKKRISTSIKVMIKDATREKQNRKELIAHLTKNLIELKKERIWHYSDLPFKFIFRFFKMYIKGY